MRTHNTGHRRILLAGAGLAAAPAAGLLLAPSAAAADLPANQIGDAIGATADALAGTTPVAPSLPTIPSPVVPAGDILPNLLLRREGDAEGVSGTVAEQPTAAAGPDPETTGYKIQAAQILADQDSRDDLIGQFVGTVTSPDGGQIDQLRDGVGHLVGNITSGQALRDVQQTFDDFLVSDSYTAWRDNTDNAFAPRSVEDFAGEDNPAVARAAAGFDALIDSFSINPLGTAQQILAEAGGPLRVLTDPVGASRDVLVKIAGPDFVDALGDFITGDLIPDLRDTLAEALPWLALPLATGAAGGLLGLVGSVLATLPLTAGLPLLGSSAGSALALVVLATLTYGTWLLSEVAVAIPVAAVALIVGVIVGVGLATLSGFNPVMLLAAIGGGLLTALFVFTMGMLAYTLLTFLIPTIAFLLLSPLFIGAGAGLGALAGLAIGTILAGVIIPAVTGMFALGGAAAGIIPAVGMFLFVLLTRFASRSNDWMDGPLGQVAESLRRGWESSALRHVFDDLGNIWDGTDTGNTLNELGALLASLVSEADFLDGEALRDLLVTGGVLGGLAGLLASLGLGLATGIPTALLSYIPNLILVGGPWLAIAAASLIGALASALIPPAAIAAAAWIIGSLAVSAPLWIPLTLAATVLTLIAFALSNPVIIAALGTVIPGLGAFLGAGGAFITGAVGAGLAILDVVVILGALAIGLVLIGLPVFLLTLPLFTFGALASQIPVLLSLPFPFIVAAGLSLLEGSAVGLATTALTMPGLVGGGAALGAILAILSNLDLNAYITDGDTAVVDARLRNPHLPTVDSLLSGTSLGAKSKVAPTAVPAASLPEFGTDNRVGERTVTDITNLIPA